MTRTTIRRCGQCGARAVVGVARAGRLTMLQEPRSSRFRRTSSSLPAQKCGAEWIDEAAAKALDEALERVYERQAADSAGRRPGEDLERGGKPGTRGASSRSFRLGYLSKLKLDGGALAQRLSRRWPWCPRAPNADWRSWTISTTPPGHANAPPARNWKSRVARTRRLQRFRRRPFSTASSAASGGRGGDRPAGEKAGRRHGEGDPLGTG